MNRGHRTPGSRLRAIAERVFDRSTLDWVILPALADLQHECSESVGGTRSRRVICWRAYWSVWKTFGICLVTDGVCSPHGVSGTIARRTAACVAGLIPVLILPGLIQIVFSAGQPFTMAFSAHPRFTLAEALKVAVFLLPQALLACLPAAFFFSLVLYRKEDRPEGAAVIPSVIAGTLVCAILVSILSALPRPTEPVGGVSEMTQHFAFVALVPVLALLGYGLSNRGRARRAMFAVALALQTLYYACFSLAATNFAKPYLYGPWAVNGAFLLLALWLLRPTRPGIRITS